MHKVLLKYSYSLLIIIIFGLLAAGCSSEMPGSIEPRNKESLSSLFSNPDTVEVSVSGKVSEKDLRWGHPSDVEQAWLDRHDYVYVRTEHDSLKIKTIQKAEKDAKGDLTEGSRTITGDRIYVHFPWLTAL